MSRSESIFLFGLAPLLAFSGCSVDKLERVAFGTLQTYERRNMVEDQPYRELNYDYYQRFRALSMKDTESGAEEVEDIPILFRYE